VAGHQVPIAFPALTGFPEVSGLALLGSAVALAGALCSPPPAVPYSAPAPVRQQVAA
jgi:hypothetical protein